MKKNLLKITLFVVTFSLLFSFGIVNAAGYTSDEFAGSYTIVPAPTMTYNNLTKIAPGEIITFASPSSFASNTVRYWWDNDKAVEKTGSNITINAPYTTGTHVLNYEVKRGTDSTGWRSCLYEVTNNNTELRLKLMPTPGYIGVASAASNIDVSLVGQNGNYYYENNNYYGNYYGNSITYSWNNGASYTIQANNASIPYPKTAGVNILNLRYTTSAGQQVSKNYYYYSSEDTVAPNIRSVYPNSGNVVPGQTIKLYLDDANGIADVNCFWQSEGYTFTPKYTNASKTEAEVTVPNSGYGTQTLYIIAKDDSRFHNQTTWQAYNYVISNTGSSNQGNNQVGAPIITFSPYSDTISTNQKVLVTITDSDNIASYGYAWDNDSYRQQTVSNKTSVNLTLTPPSSYGSHTLRVWAQDRYGNNTGTVTKNYYVQSNYNGSYDNGYNSGLPTIYANVSNGMNVSANSTIDVTFSANNSLSLIQWAWDNGSYQQEYVNSYNYTKYINVPSTAGTHTLRITARDSYNNTSSQTYTIYVNTNYNGSNNNGYNNGYYGNDYTAPTVRMSSTTAYAGKYITAYFKDSNSGLDVIGWAWDSDRYQEKSVGGKTSEYSHSIYVPTTIGNHTLYLNAKDRNGNTSGWKSYNVYVSANGYTTNGNNSYYNDYTAPTITFSSTSAKSGSYVTVKFKDSGSGLNLIGWAWDSESYQQEFVNTTTSTYSHKIYVPNSNGSHTLYLNAKDANGNETGWKKYTVKVTGGSSNGDYTAPTINFASTSVNRGGYITPKFTDNNSGLALVGWAWDYEPYQQSAVNGVTSTYSHSIYVPFTSGTHTLYLNAKDREGNKTGWKKYTITVR